MDLKISTKRSKITHLVLAHQRIALFGTLAFFIQLMIHLVFDGDGANSNRPWKARAQILWSCSEEKNRNEWVPPYLYMSEACNDGAHPTCVFISSPEMTLEGIWKLKMLWIKGERSSSHACNRNRDVVINNIWKRKRFHHCCHQRNQSYTLHCASPIQLHISQHWIVVQHPTHIQM